MKMTNSKSTKRALLTSALAIMMCLAMLIGTTFAWFTDTASTSVNTIQAGTLDVALEMWNGEKWVNAEGETLDFVKASAAAGQSILWEPGCTYELPKLRIVNKGNLALKFRVLINGIDGDAKLNEAIEWYYSIGTPTEEVLPTEGGADAASARGITPSAEDGWLALSGLSEEGYLLPAGTDGPSEVVFTICGYMKEEAGNEYQTLKIEGAAITVYATQYTYESDSYGNQYDASAEYPIQTGTTLEADDLADGTSISGVSPEKTVTNVNALVLNKKNVTISNMTINGTGASGNDGSLNIRGDNTTIQNVKYNGQGQSAEIGITVSTGTSNSGTTFRNMEIKNVFRGIQFWNLSGASVIDNCVIDVAGYTFNVDAVEAGATLTVKNSTLKGWTSYTNGISKVTFDNCKFGKNTYEYLRPYSDTEIKNCEFTSEGYELNASGTGAYTITIQNCTKNGTPITADNVVGLLLDSGNWNHNATLIVDGTTVTVP